MVSTPQGQDCAAVGRSGVGAKTDAALVMCIMQGSTCT